MLLVCKGGAVIARHDDGQDVRASAYGAGAVILPWSARYDFHDPVQAPDVRVFKPIGAAPEHGTDVRLPAVPALAAADLKAATAWRRWEVETGGLDIEGIQVPTDREAQFLIKGLRDSAERGDIPLPFTFKDRTGARYPLDLVHIQGLCAAVVAHVAASRAREDAVAEAIDAGTVTTLDQIAAADWPSNG